MKLYTIGFTRKSAETFFELLRKHSVERLVDIRLNPSGQLSGFAKKEDLPYFLTHLVPGCDYVHMPELAPTKEILQGFRTERDWNAYQSRFEALMDARDIPGSLDRDQFTSLPNCLLCSEATPEKCHRRLVAERMARTWPEIQIEHL